MQFTFFSDYIMLEARLGCGEAIMKEGRIRFFVFIPEDKNVKNGNVKSKVRKKIYSHFKVK